MALTTPIHVDAERERGTANRMETHEVRYLDMSGDGVPDAVEYIDRWLLRRGDSSLDTLEEKRRLSYGIGIDGEPTGFSERTTTFLRDDAGRLRQVDVADC